jgi:hypothetical protein
VSPARPLAVVAALGLAACSSSGTHAPQAPSDARPGALAVTVADFQDTDANWYRDSTTAVVYVYADSAAYPIPITVNGSFEFVLETRDGKTLARWAFDDKQTAAAYRKLAPGPGYIFELNLIRLGVEQSIKVREADIRCTFVPANGQSPLHSRPLGPIQVGPISRSRTGNPGG